MIPDDCTQRLEPAQAWALIASGFIPKWCVVCKRFRKGLCARVVVKRAEDAARRHATRVAHGKVIGGKRGD